MIGQELVLVFKEDKAYLTARCFWSALLGHSKRLLKDRLLLDDWSFAITRKTKRSYFVKSRLTKMVQGNFHNNSKT